MEEETLDETNEEDADEEEADEEESKEEDKDYVTLKENALEEDAEEEQPKAPKEVGSFNREMHKAVCSDCGKECEVPFKPIEGRPVYCRDCYRKHIPRRRY